MSRIARDLATSPHKPFFGSEPESELKHSLGSMNQLRTGKLPHVAVVGAGFSGLRCADVLVRAGVRVTIFEARDRVGGRVHQIKSGGHLVDTGPNWIHGTVGNPISRLAQKTGTPVMELEERQIIFNPDGRQLSEKDSGHIAEEIWGMIIQAFKYSDEKSANIDNNMSLMDYFRQELPKRFPNDQDKIDTLITEARMWGPFVGEPIERQSLKFFFLEECLDGENTLMAGTYQKVLQEVSRVALEQAEIKLQEEVIQIGYRKTDDGTPITIQTKSGGKHAFDEVVVSCPLGWLKRNELTAFTPPLPVRLSEAIQNIGYGKLEKLYVSFPSAFWLENGDVHGDRNGNRQKDFSYPCFTHFQQPTYHPFPESKDSLSWNQSVISLAHLPDPTAHPTLLFYIYGDCGTYLTNLLENHEPHSTTYNELLDDFARPFYSRLPNYVPTSDSCRPTSYYLTSWQLDPLAGYGSYSNFQIGLENGDEDIEVMRNAGGLSEQGRGLWLAGEHTAPFVAIGTTTGAWWSGEGVARRIIKQYGLKVEEDTLSLTVDEAGKENPDVNGQFSQKDARVTAASQDELRQLSHSNGAV